MSASAKPRNSSVKGAPVVGEHDAANHHQHTGGIGLPDEEPQRLLPGAAGGPRSHVETECLGHATCRVLWPVRESRAADESRLGHAHCQREIAIPALPFLAGVEHVEQFGAGTPQPASVMGAEIRDWQRLFRRLGQEQIADGHMDGLRERFQLLECGLRFAGFPFAKLREAALQLAGVLNAGPLPCPAQQLRGRTATRVMLPPR